MAGTAAGDPASQARNIDLRPDPDCPALQARVAWAAGFDEIDLAASLAETQAALDAFFAAHGPRGANADRWSRAGADDGLDAGFDWRLAGDAGGNLGGHLDGRVDRHTDQSPGTGKIERVERHG